jgi:RHS repeat-associated protein
VSEGGGVARQLVYDFVDRLTARSGDLTYGYTAAGDRSAETVDGRTATYTYNHEAVARKLGPSGAPQYGFSYDFQFNMAGIAAFDATGTSITGVICFKHDELGRLTVAGTLDPVWFNPGMFNGGYYCVYGPTTATVQFKYDHRNRRIARWQASTNLWTYIVSDEAGNPLSELLRTGDPASPWRKVRDYVWLDGLPLAQIEYPTSTTSFTYYYHLDHIGLPRALTNAAGQVVWSAATRPYGDIAETVTPDPLSGTTVVTNLRLPGQYDERLFAAAGIGGMQGPYYNWNRWYLPSVGRYLELDPLAMEGGFNSEFGVDWYNYASANPLIHIDPTGEFDNGSCPGCEDTCCCAAVKYGPDACPGAPPPNPKPKPKPTPTCDPPPPPPPPPGNGCKCTCLGRADPNWNPDDKRHGERNVGMVWFDAECRAECRSRGFAPEQYQCPKVGR